METSIMNWDRESELKTFDDTRAGVKGLADNGITKVPRIFLHPQTNNSVVKIHHPSQDQFPLIDLKNAENDPIARKQIVERVKSASEKWGFFQVINHGIPDHVMREMLEGTKRFYEMGFEEKKEWYTRDQGRRFLYNSNFDLFSAPSANWRDTFFCQMIPDPPKPEELPAVCRDIMYEYVEHVVRLGRTLFQLLSEALGLESDRLERMQCEEGLAILGHYYPKCPEPELTYGTSQHADSDFLTVLLNDRVEGLQVLHQGGWADVPDVPGALVVNIGDLLQLLSNDKFVSSEHRVLASDSRARVSVACFFRGDLKSTLYGPIEELLSEDNRARFRETTVKEYVTYYNERGLDGTSALSHFRI